MAYEHFAERLKERFGTVISEKEYLELTELLKTDRQLHTDPFRGSKYHAVDYKGRHIYPVVLIETGELATVYTRSILNQKIETSMSLKEKNVNSLNTNREILIQAMRKMSEKEKITRASMEAKTNLTKNEVRIAMQSLRQDKTIIYVEDGACFRLAGTPVTTVKTVVNSFENDLEIMLKGISKDHIEKEYAYKFLDKYNKEQINTAMAEKGYNAVSKWFTLKNSANWKEIVACVTTETSAHDLVGKFPKLALDQITKALAYATSKKILVRVKPGVYASKKLYKKLSLMDVTKQKETLSLMEIQKSRQSFVVLKLGQKNGTDYAISTIIGTELVKDLKWKEDEHLDIEWVKGSTKMQIVPKAESHVHLVKGEDRFACVFPAYFNMGLPYPSDKEQPVAQKRIIGKSLEIDFSNFAVK